MPVPHYAAGDIILYRCFETEERRVQVTQRSADIKRGKPGFEGRHLNGIGVVWGYDDQIIEVITSARRSHA